MLFFHKRWWLKKKKFPNRHTVLSSVWSDRCGVTSRRFWPAVYWKKSDPMAFFFRARIIHVNVQCLPYRKKRERYWSTVAPENEEHLGPENWVHYAQELRFFSQRTSMWRYKMLLTDSILGTMISLSLSIFLDMKISGVTLFGGMVDWRNDGKYWIFSNGRP